ncbi:preprotein translocase subunit SecE [Candidatus Izemoplasma sp. B36]|uniref:preprotein translocase subunit SecE n=1 Tax=Candidatus Izemoplasma sp. B36 TaxID=3242468 RepID=UPI0035592614
MAKKPNKVVKPTKTNEKKLQSESKIMEILKKEYTFENWLLAILSPILILYGVYIVMGRFGDLPLDFAEEGFIGFFLGTTLARILTGSFLILIGALVLVYLLIPYVRPSVVELKKVTWPTSKTLATNTAKVFIFLIFLAVFFTLVGFAFGPLFEWLYSL